MKRLFVTKIVFTLMLFITLLFVHQKIYSQDDSTLFSNKELYSAHFASDILTAGVSYDFIKRKKWSVGIETIVGSGLRICLTNPENFISCTKECDKDNQRLFFEGIKVMPYFRYYYFRNNNIDIGLNISWMANILLEEMPPTETNMSYGLDVSAYYGWRKIKLGTGFQFNINTIRYSQNDINSRLVILWTPLKLLIPIQKKR